MGRSRPFLGAGSDLGSRALSAIRYTLAETYRLLRRYEDFDRTMDQVYSYAHQPQTGDLTVERALGDFDRPSRHRSLCAPPWPRASAANNLDEEMIKIYMPILFALWDRDPRRHISSP